MHDCNRCGSACYCHGDIDDCPVETIEYAYEHCVGCGCLDDEESYFFYDEDEDIEYAADLETDEMAPEGTEMTETSTPAIDTTGANIIAIPFPKDAESVTFILDGKKIEVSRTLITIKELK